MRFFTAAVLLLAGLAPAVLAAPPLDWPQVYTMIYEQFPDVAEKSVPELSRLMKEEASLFLIDARKRKEFSVSHIKGAINLTSVPQIQRQIPQKDALIIVYCSVGYRSASAVADLRRQGYTNAFNLRGSIFEWANSGHKVYQGKTETTQVHPFNFKYGILLNKKYHYKSIWPWW